MKPFPGQLRTGRIAGPRDGAFTMVELIVVIVILSVAAGLIIPRVTGRSSRSAEAEVRRVAVALNAAVRRAVVSSQRTALAFERDGATVSVQVAKPANVRSFELQKAQWQDDLMEPAFTLAHIEFVGGTTDDFPLDPARFRLEFSPEFKRPEIGLVFQSLDGAGRWRVRLEQSSLSSAVSPADDPGFGGATVVDLDAIGQRDSAW